MKSVSPDVIFYMDSGDIVAHNSLTQRSFALDQEHFNRLLEINAGSKTSNATIDDNLLEGKLVIEEQIHQGWKGDRLSRLAYNFLKIRNEHTPKVTKEQVFDNMLGLSNSVEEVSPSAFSSLNFEKQIHLPAPNPHSLNSMGLYDALHGRFTCRQFTNDPIDMESLSTVLHVNFGYINGKSWEDLEKSGFKPNGFRKANPSASGTQTFEACVIVLKVEGLEDGIYWYDPDNHSLGLLKSGFSQDDLSSLVCDQYWTHGIACGVLLVADLRRVWMKDIKTRGFVTSYAEAGHISENILLSCTALGLQTWITGTFRDEDIQRSILMNSPYLSPCFFVGFGHGKPTGVPKDLDPSAI